MKCFYKCACFEQEAEIDIPSRGPDEDINLWMNSVSKIITTDHRRRSPTCQEASTEYFKIPLPSRPDVPLGTQIQ